MPGKSNSLTATRCYGVTGRVVMPGYVKQCGKNHLLNKKDRIKTLNLQFALIRKSNFQTDKE